MKSSPSDPRCNVSRDIDSFPKRLRERVKSDNHIDVRPEKFSSD